ncbi:hypothetical protein GOP47_0000504 [Adiantum capillus-veneris]|uniref:NADP-dependent oxidoreductase domain-containing protein n=1 Tax=Adiantum capillus-veneris TaxID=13818 RepID=A0A9D4VE28_ADICA|nr:hypothetical protein GOP47_0000504 [Adiantum capillus-veneris]
MAAVAGTGSQVTSGKVAIDTSRCGMKKCRVGMKVELEILTCKGLLPRVCPSVPRPLLLPQLHQRKACCSVRAYSTPAVSFEPLADPSSYIPGRADFYGTSQYAQRIGPNAGPGHFRQLKVGGQLGDLIVSSLGVGTFGGSEYEEVDKDYVKTIIRGFNLGINLIDTASNYRSMHSELAIGQCMAKAVQQGIVKRNEVIVCSKGGFLSFDYRESVEPRTYIEDKYVKTGLFQWDEFVGGVHCLATPFIMNQLEISRRNMGLETIDIYYVHNPEIELGVVSRSAVLSRLRNLFVALEQAVRDGKISMYGVSSWNAFRVTSGAKNYLSLEELVNFAKAAAGGEDHHFKVVMVPFNLHLQDVATNATQSIRGKRVPLLHAAAHFGINVITSSPLFQGTLAKNIAPDVKQRFPELGDSRTDAQCALQFSRTTPGILATLTGMSKLSHMEENGAIVRRPALSRS